MFLVMIALSIPLANASAQVYLTGVEVFSTDSSGNWTGPDIWDTYSGGNYEIWIQSGGVFLNGPSDPQVQPNIQLASGVQSFALNADPGSDWSSFGINLFFNGAVTPSISAFGPMLTAAGPHSFAADGAAITPGIPNTTRVPGSGTLSFVSGGQLVTLTDFYWATPSVYNQDLVGEYSTGADGQMDYVGGVSLSVTPVPEPEALCWSTDLVLAALMICRKMKYPKTARVIGC